MKKYIFLLLFASSFFTINAQFLIKTNPTSFPVSGHLQNERYYTVKEIQDAVNAQKNSEIGLFSSFYIPDGRDKSTLPKIATLDTLKAAGIFGAATVSKKRAIFQLSQNSNNNPSFAAIFENNLGSLNFTRLQQGVYFSQLPAFQGAVYGQIFQPNPNKMIIFERNGGINGLGYYIYCNCLSNGSFLPCDTNSMITVEIFEP